MRRLTTIFFASCLYVFAMTPANAVTTTENITNGGFTYKGKSVAVPDVARELGVKYVLEGSVRRVGDVVRINTQLIDGASGAHIWAERYDGSLTDIFALQDKVTSQIVAQLQLTLTPDEQRLQVLKGTDNPDAYDAYLRARPKSS